jgi:prophage regulatory protein
MKILKLPEVIKATALSRSSIYAFIGKNAFPAPVPLGNRAVGWLEDEVNDWINQKASSRKKLLS